MEDKNKKNILSYLNFTTHPLNFFCIEKYLGKHGKMGQLIEEEGFV